MNLIRYIRSHLNIKLFLSFVIIIFVFTVVLIAAVEFIMPNAFQRHMLFMESILADQEAALLNHDDNLYASFRSAIYESMLFAIPVSLLSALLISLAFSRRFIKPINTMVSASRRIGEGKYSERIRLPGNVRVEEMDELNQLAVSFNQMADKLEKIEDLRKKLIGDVSHELRTPLAYIKGSMEGLIDGVVSPTEKTFFQIQVEAERLAKLVDDLQELSRIEEGAYPLKKTEGNINRVIEHVIGILSPRYQGKNLTIVKDFNPVVISASFDENRIKQVLSNLLSNALKYSRKGGRVVVTSRIHDDHVQVSIADEGIGISEENLPFIFTRFFRADKSRSRASGGSGIGLTIARQLVEAHGGSIHAHSEGINKGAVFSFTLPID